MCQSSNSSSDALFTFYCEIFSIPVRKFKTQIEELRDGLSGAEEQYITQSMVQAFIQVVFLLADSASEVSRLLKGSDSDGESSKTKEDNTEDNTEDGTEDDPGDEPMDRSGWPDFLGRSVHSKNQPGPPMRIISRRDVRAYSYDEDEGRPPTPRRRYARSEVSLESRRRRSSRRTRRGDLPLHLNDHVDQIIGYLDDARYECCAMFGSKDQGESTYNGVDCGRIISLVLDSVLRGHSTCGSIPALDIEEIYTTWTTSLVRSLEPNYMYSQADLHHPGTRSKKQTQ